MANGSTNLVPLNDPQPAALFQPGGLDELLAKIEHDARALVPDASTAKGRKAIASVAAKVARSKTYLDGLGKDHVSALKEQAKAVDAVRRDMRERLDNLKAEVRQPLTQWEEAEAERQAELQRRLELLRDIPEDTPELTAALVAARIAEVEAVEIGDDWHERREDAETAKAATLYQLGQLHATVKAREEAAAKAEAERREREETERRKREERIRQEERERADRDAEAERRRIETERADAERAAADAERRARQAEEAAKRNAEEAARIERYRAERKAAAEREAEEQRRRNRKHAAAVNNAAAAALAATAGLTDDQAKATVIAIAKGQIPGVSIRY